MTLRRMYRDSLALLTDLYQLTMASGYFQSGLAEREAVFHLVFRKCPFGGQYAVACGLQSVIEFVEQFALAEDDVDYLRSLTAPGGGPLFDKPFLDYFRRLRLQCDIDAMPEGTVVFAHEPLLRVRGPLIACQLLETVLLNLVNFPTLVATKAARVCYAARGETVLEFGLRRAQGIDGGLAASRAAFVGGCDATSNVLAGKLLGIPVRGTHAHSWVMTFDDETEAFRTYARVMPQNCILLVDTYDSIRGVHNAIRVGQQLKREGRRLAGLRLDSGDLAELSRQARRMLDEAGFSDTTIVASSDLDEYEIERLKQRGSAIDVWGVGTRLATAYDQPALGGVYKLSALRDPQGAWQYKVKLSDDLAKASSPGIQQVRRFFDDQGMRADVIYDQPTGIASPVAARSLDDRHDISLPQDASSHEDLLVPIFRSGRRVYEPPALDAIQSRTREQLAQLAESVQRLQAPEPYPVGLERQLQTMKQNLLQAVRRTVDEAH